MPIEPHDSPAMVAEELDRQLGPAFMLADIIRGAAFQWRRKRDEYTGDDPHAWFGEIPGMEFMWIDPDLDAIHAEDAVVIGLVDRFADAFRVLRRAVEEDAKQRYEERTRREGGAA